MREIEGSLPIQQISTQEVPFNPEQRRSLPITVLYGGDSAERPGSIKSGNTVARLLREAGYEHVNTLDLTKGTLSEISSLKPDGVAFLTMHGGYGEDGSLQGLLEMMDIPYTGSGISASAISADKVLFSNFIRGLGYKTAEQIVVNGAEELEGVDLEYPKVIKPATQGCSYGVFFVRDKAELLKRAPFTQQFSDRIIVEDYVPGREFTVGVFEDPHAQKPHVLPIAENILVREIQDFETKTQGGEHLSKVVVPADLDTEVRDRIQAACADVFKQLNCRGYVRMDIRITPDGEIYFLENNTSPGMLSLEESDFPKALQAEGINPSEFVDLMIEACLLNYQSRKESAGKIPGKKEMASYFKSL